MGDNELFRAIQLIRDKQWDEAHELVQSRRDSIACWIHGWLHRQEGDLGNARYWYNLANQPFNDTEPGEELERIEQAIG